MTGRHLLLWILLSGVIALVGLVVLLNILLPDSVERCGSGRIKPERPTMNRRSPLTSSRCSGLMSDRRVRRTIDRGVRLARGFQEGRAVIWRATAHGDRGLGGAVRAQWI